MKVSTVTENAPKFEIGIDGPRRLMTVVLRGFWDKDTIDSFRAEVQAAIVALRDVKGLYVLVDASEFSVPSRDNIERLVEFPPDLATKVKGVALVVSSALIRLQSVRTDRSERRQIFASRDEALQWVLEANDAN